MTITQNDEIKFWHTLETLVRAGVAQLRSNGSNLEYDGHGSGSIILRNHYYPTLTHRIERKLFDREIDCSLETILDDKSEVFIQRTATFLLMEDEAAVYAVKQDESDVRLNVQQMAGYISEPFFSRIRKS